MRKLTLPKIHQLYLLLRDYLPEQEERYLIDELIAIFEKAKPGTIFDCLKIMYPNKEPKDSLNGIEMFIEGMKENEFFEYVSFINGVKRARRDS